MCVSWLTMQEDSVCGSLVLCSRAEHPGDRQECEGGDGCPSLHGTQAEQTSWEPGSSRTATGRDQVKILLQGSNPTVCLPPSNLDILLSGPNSSFPALIHSALPCFFCSECRQRIFSVASFRMQFAVSTTRWRNGNLAPSNEDSLI